jgi:hypothetical protein
MKFNTFSGKNDLVVRGMIDIEGDEIIIERKMKRSRWWLEYNE